LCEVRLWVDGSADRASFGARIDAGDGMSTPCGMRDDVWINGCSWLGRADWGRGLENRGSDVAIQDAVDAEAGGDHAQAGDDDDDEAHDGVAQQFEGA
jgi:hypothetical protein